MKAVNVIVLEANKTEGFIQSYPESPSLADMQELVGGYIELVDLNDTKYMVVNEEGYVYKLPYNTMANQILSIYRPELAKFNSIFGNVFLIDKKDIK